MGRKRSMVAYAATAAIVGGFAAQAVADEWNAGAGNDWDALLAAAKKEGEVVVSVCPGATETLGKAFKDDTGIDISFVTGNIRDLGSRFDTELRSGRVATDVRLAGSSGAPYLGQGLLAPLNDELILPNVTNQANWLGGKMGWLDNDETYLPVPAEYVAGFPVINADIIDPAGITSWQDLMKPEFKGKIAAFDPTDSIGSATSQYLAKTYGLDFVAKLYKEQVAIISRDRRQLVEWVARGTYPIALGADAAQEIEPFHEAGFTSIQALTMADAPGNLVGGCSVAQVPVKAPHPNAARVFINWYLSNAGQAAYVAGMHQPTDRLDVANDGVPDYLVPRQGLKYFSTYREDYVLHERTKLIEEIGNAIGQ